MAQGTPGLNLIEAMHARFGGGELGKDPDAVDPAALRRCAGWTRLFFGRDRYFELDAQGWEHLPDTASMIVSNHSGGTSIPDAWGLVVSWYQHVGFQRPLLMMGHDMVFAIKGLGEAFERVGVMRAGRVAARRALGEQGRDLLVFPGGDRDTWRPFSQRYAVRFSGRRGYARIAVEAGVPIVPVAHVGAHHTLVVLTDGEKMARRMGLPALARATIFPVHLSLPWGLAIGPMPHLPPPTTLHYRIRPPEHPDPTLEPEAAADDLDARVRASIQAGLDQLRRERRAAKQERRRRR